MTDIIVFEGRKYRRQANGYYASEQWGKKFGPTMLHRAVWEHSNGPIPEGWHVHHKDGDPSNNDIDNLEALPMKDHLSMHARESGWVGSPENIAQLNQAREAASRWHASPEGRAWHSENAKRAWKSREWHTVDCQEDDCSNRFMTPYPTRAKFCSSACKERSRQRRLGANLSKRRGAYGGKSGYCRG